MTGCDIDPQIMETLDALGDGAKTGRDPKPKKPIMRVRDLPAGSVSLDCNGDPILKWADGSYARPQGRRLVPVDSGACFGPYTIVATGLPDDQLEVLWSFDVALALQHMIDAIRVAVASFIDIAPLFAAVARAHQARLAKHAARK